MGAPGRFEFRFTLDYWVLPGAIFLALAPQHVSSFGIAIGPFALAVNWGPYMREARA